MASIKLISALTVLSTCWINGLGDQIKAPEYVTSQHLLDEVLRRASTHVHPSLDKHSPVQVELNFTLTRVEDINQRRDTFTIGLIVGQTWTDPRLAWNASAFGNIDVIRIPTGLIWTPDLTIYNGDDEPMQVSHDDRAILVADGKVMWFPMVIFTAHCAMDFGSYPFDTQHCSLLLGSWVYTNTDVTFHFTNDTNSKIMEAAVRFDTTLDIPPEHPQWELLGNQAKATITDVSYNAYATFHVIDISLDLKRKSDYYRYVTVGPSVLLTLMVPIIFLLPPRALEKIIYGVGVLIAELLVILMLQEEIPFNHGSTPRLAKYHLITMCLASLSVCVSVFVMWLTEKGRYRRTVPGWVHKGILGRRGLRWILCVDSLRPVDKFYSTLTSRSMEDEFVDLDHDAEDGGRELDAVASAQNKQLSDIQKSFRTILGKLSADEAFNNVQREWEELALVVDRLCFIAFYVIFVLLSMGMA